jgi:hypothetical protein
MSSSVLVTSLKISDVLTLAEVVPGTLLLLLSPNLEES